MPLYEELIEKYLGQKTGGVAFFWNDSIPGSPSLHLVLSDLKWESSYGANYSKSGVEGTFFYNDGYFDKLPKDQATKADFLVSQHIEDRVPFVHITFYAPNSRDELLGEFLAQDARNTAASSNLLNIRLESEWKFQS